MLGILINIVGYVDLSQATSVTPVTNQICQHNILMTRRMRSMIVENIDSYCGTKPVFKGIVETKGGKGS